MNPDKQAPPSRSAGNSNKDEFNLYFVELLNKSYAVPGKIKALTDLIIVPYTGKQFPILDEQVKEKLRDEIVDDLFFIIDNLNRPQLLGNRMLKLATAVRYGWNGRGLNNRRS